MKLLHYKHINTGAGKDDLEISKNKKIEWILIGFLILSFVGVSFSQTGINDINYGVKSDFEPTIKDAIKFADLPEIKDSVRQIKNIKYGIASNPMFPKYETQLIGAAKMKNEPLPKLYYSLLKIGYGPLYNMPYGEFWIANNRSRDNTYGAHLKHLSSTTHLKDVGYGGFSDNGINVFGKKMYKKHSLKGDFNYERNVIHYYGFDTTLNHINDNNYTRQRYQLFEPKIQLQSHYTDSTHINHDLKLSYYNLQNLNREEENNIKVKADGSFFINKEKLNLNILTDFYNHKQSNDTLNNLIFTLNPSFEARGVKWHANVGIAATIDNFKDKTRFYFYPQLNVNYNVYENMIVPYAGVKGGLIKNSFRSLTHENPFTDTTLRYTNTNNKYNIFGGIRGNLSSNTSYDAAVSYAQYDSLYFYVIDYGGPNQLYNHFNVLYDNTSLITVGGQLKHQLKEKLNLIASGNYYIYKPKNLIRAYHKPDFDLTFSGIYNLQSKIILRADLIFMGKQWALTQVTDTGTSTLKPKQLKGWADLNLEAEYRYSKMLSFFARANNIANQRYFRWERYPTQRFNFMIGLTFVPF